jgi:rhodanese-related sulfurtransferase
LAELFAGLSHGSIELVDVREPHEFAVGHVSGSRDMPLSTVDPHQLPTQKPIVFSCQAGKRSAIALEKEKSRGRSQCPAIRAGICRLAEGGCSRPGGVSRPMAPAFTALTGTFLRRPDRRAATQRPAQPNVGRFVGCPIFDRQTVPHRVVAAQNRFSAEDAVVVGARDGDSIGALLAIADGFDACFGTGPRFPRPPPPPISIGRHAIATHVELDWSPIC